MSYFTNMISLHEFDGREDETGERELRHDQPTQYFHLEVCARGLDFGVKFGFDLANLAPQVTPNLFKISPCRHAIPQGGVQSLGLGARLFIVETGGCQPVDIGQAVEGQSG